MDGSAGGRGAIILESSRITSRIFGLESAQMPAQNDEISDLDDTGINEAVTVNTVEMPAEKGKPG